MYRPVMSNEQQHQSRDRGSLFANAEKRKPSQPDMRGDCTIAGVPYEAQAWEREGQLVLTIAPARGGGKGPKHGSGTEGFRGALDPGPGGEGGGKRGRGEGGPAPSWTGTIVGDGAAYVVQAFPKQGKSGAYLTLSFEPTTPPEVAPTPEPFLDAD